MKTQIIYLDSHDDVASAKDKLSWAKAPRVVLVWPARGEILTRRLDLVLLQRYTADRGGQLGLVCHHPEIISSAEELGIPVFPSPDHVRDELWARSRARRIQQKQSPQQERNGVPAGYSPSWRTSDTPNSPIRGIGSIFIISVLVVIIAVLIIPSADIGLAMPSSSTEVMLEIPLSSEVTVDPIKGEQPYRYQNTVLETNARITTSGEAEVPDTYASGKVIFTLLGSDPLTLPFGTKLSTSGVRPIRFSTGETITLTPDDQSTIEVAITADQPGPSGNVDENTITEVVEVAPDLVTVNNPQPTSGGENIQHPTVTTADTEELFNDASNEILQQAREEFSEQLDDGEVLPEGALVIEAIVDEEYDHQIGDVADTIGLTLSLQVGGFIVNQATVEERILGTLSDSWSREWEGIPGTVDYDMQITHTDQPDREATVLEIQASQLTLPIIDEDRIHRAVRLQPISKAIDIIEDEIALEASPKIDIHPKWFPLMPFLQAQIQIHPEPLP